MPLMIALAKILGTEDAGCGYGSEDRQVVYKDQLVHDSDTGHLLRTQLSYHNII